MGCCCNDKKEGKKQGRQTPDCMASKSTVVTTPEGEEVEVYFNMATGEVSYPSKKDGKSDPEKGCGCGCSK